MLKNEIFHQGQMWGALYEFTETGDIIPPHSHIKLNDHHNVICLKGSIEIPEFSIKLVAGDIAEFDCTKDHTVIALEPNSKTLHLCINGKPTFAEYL